VFSFEISTNFKEQNFRNNIRAMQSAINEAEKAALDEVVPLALELANKTTVTWSKRPSFKAKRVRTGNGYTVEIWVSDQRWLWLDQGTRVRYATMEQGFIAKTRKGVLYSYKGSGQVAYVRKDTPRPGIEARGWSALIAEKVAPKVRAAYQAEFHKRWKFD